MVAGAKKRYLATQKKAIEGDAPLIKKVVWSVLVVPFHYGACALRMRSQCSNIRRYALTSESHSIYVFNEVSIL